MAHNGFIHGLSSLKFKNQLIGLIAEEGIDWGGDEPSTVKIYSAQKRGTPAVELADNPGSDSISFTLIELKPDNLKEVFGGEVATEAGKKVWKAPATKLLQEGAFEITTHDGTVIGAGKASLHAKFSGKIKHNEVLGLKCTLTILSDGETAPMSFGFPETEASPSNHLG